MSTVLVLAAAAGISAAQTAASSKTQAAALVARTLLTLPRYPGARRAPLHGFPIPRMPSTWASPELVAGHALWYVPASGDRFAVWVAATLAAQGLYPAGSASAGDGAGGAVTSLFFTPAPDPDQLQVEISWQGTGGQATAVRYDVEAVWQPSRPAVAALPSRLTSATVSLVDRRHPRGLVATVRGQPLVRLADVYAALPMDTRGRHSCPAVIVGVVNALAAVRFVGATRVLEVQEGRATCADGVVTGADGSTVAVLFDPESTLLKAVRAVLSGKDR